MAKHSFQRWTLAWALIAYVSVSNAEEVVQDLPPSLVLDPANAASDPVGPPHGLPGYKESHNWESGSDSLSPLVFSAEFYNANYPSSKSNPQADAQREWMHGLETLRYPNCKQGSLAFSANTYYRANKAVFPMASEHPACSRLVEHFLTQGVYDGLRTYNQETEQRANARISSQAGRVDKLQGDSVAIALKKHGEDEWTLDSNSELGSFPDNSHSAGTSTAVDGTVKYSYSLWIKPGHQSPTKAAVLRIAAPGDASNTAVSPAVWQEGGKLRAQVSLQEDPEFSCEPEEALSDHKWTFVVLTVTSVSVDLYYNGKEACSCPTNGKALTHLMKRQHVSADKSEAPVTSGGRSDASVRHVFFYPGVALTPELVRAQMQLQHMKDQLEQARREERERAQERRTLKESKSP